MQLEDDDMSTALWSPAASTKIIERIVIETDLLLDTPAHFGNGDHDDVTDMPLLTDALDRKSPLLTGASLCGALRSYLEECERQRPDSICRLLFGASRDDDTGDQSRMIIDDALGKYQGHEVRPGVQIVSSSRTAAEDRLYSTMLWEAGTKFPVRLDLQVKEGDDRSRLLQGVATALDGLDNGSITLGGRKTRGLGRISTNGWRIRRYNLCSNVDLLAWINTGADRLSENPAKKSVFEALNIDRHPAGSVNEFQVQITCQMIGSMMIRSQASLGANDPDSTHLRTKNGKGKNMPIISGTSLAGVLRSRATKIVSTICGNNCVDEPISRLFGTSSEEAGPARRASRLIVKESFVENSLEDLVQHRVSIDRFTGGARDTALFSENPLFAKPATTLNVEFRLRRPSEAEIGLLLLLAKDLWSGDLPIGGESGVGRGRLQGLTANLIWQNGTSGTEKWTISENGKGLEISGDRQRLESFVASLNVSLKGGRYA